MDDPLPSLGHSTTLPRTRSLLNQSLSSSLTRPHQIERHTPISHQIPPGEAEEVLERGGLGGREGGGRGGEGGENKRDK